MSMKRMVLLMTVFTLLWAIDVSAQDRQGPPRDPKAMTERLAKDLNFTDAQNQQLVELNKKNDGNDYDRKGYMDGFKKILTTEQQQELDDRRQKRMGGGRRGGAN